MRISVAVGWGVSRLSSSMTATLGCPGVYPICENPMLGLRIHPGMACGSTVHVTTRPVLPLGSVLRSTNHPFWASMRPSYRRSSASSLLMLTMRSASSVARVKRCPVSMGNGSIKRSVPRSS